MLVSRMILGMSALILMTYGLLCLVSPELPAEYSGLKISNGDAFAEIGAMYGGLQTGLGLFFLLGTAKREFCRPALVVLILAIGSLALGRLLSLLLTDQAVTAYTYGALGYELVTTCLALIALRRLSDDPT